MDADLLVQELEKVSSVGEGPNATHSPREAAKEDTHPALICSSVQDWLLEECDAFPAMLVRRSQTWDEVQHLVDEVASSGIFGYDHTLQERVKPDWEGGGELQLTSDLSAVARRLVGKIASCLPENLTEQIQRDIVEVGLGVANLLPTAKTVKVKLELMGENSCRRWHQDNYTCRAIITYNGSGTEYVEHENVNFWELHNCGNNACILLDKSRVFSANAADVLFMKGKLFPGAVNGLVHKSPERRYDAVGTIMNRLVLKVDVDDLGH